MSTNLEPFGAPIKINPTIKLLRWTFLGLGVLYGVKRHAYLDRKDKEKKAYIAKMQPVWDAEKAAKKAVDEAKQAEELKKQGLVLN